MEARYGFGIDLAGYTGGKSVSAVAVAEHDLARVTILRDCPFSLKAATHAPLAPIVKKEIAYLGCLMKLGDVAVDIPIDLQGLPEAVQASEIWELTLRPIDRALRAMPPLADRIGAPTARFQHILRTGGFENDVGARLLETYPRATLANLSLLHWGYKGRGDAAAEKRRGLLAGLNIAPSELEISDDELDAALCAITALAKPPHRIEGDKLSALLPPGRKPPCGFVLLESSPFSKVEVSKVDASRWLALNA